MLTGIGPNITRSFVSVLLYLYFVPIYLSSVFFCRGFRHSRAGMSLVFVKTMSKRRNPSLSKTKSYMHDSLRATWMFRIVSHLPSLVGRAPGAETRTYPYE